MTLARAIRELSTVHRRLDLPAKELISGTATALSLKVLAAFIAFALNVVLARLLGPAGSGLYFLALTVTTIGAVVGRAGLDNVLLRSAAANSAVGDWSALKGIYAGGTRIALCTSSLSAAIIFLIAPVLADKAFSQPGLTSLIRLMALSIIPVSLSTLHSELLKGIKRTKEAIAVLSIFTPAISLLVVYLLVPELGIAGAAMAYTVSSLMTLLVGILLWKLSTPELAGVVGYLEPSRLLKTGFPMFCAVLLQLVIQWSSFLMLGIWASSADVGIFGVASRAATLTSFALMAVNTIAAPRFAALYRLGDMAALGKIARDSARLTTILASPVLLLFIACPDTIMNLFGKGFAKGATPLSILAVGQFINVATGSVGYLLTMSGNERLFRNIFAVCALGNLLLNASLIPHYGATGAAIATATTTTLLSVSGAVIVSWKLGIKTIPFV